jgi:hypothetical protein
MLSTLDTSLVSSSSNTEEFGLILLSCMVKTFIYIQGSDSAPFKFLGYYSQKSILVFWLHKVLELNKKTISIHIRVAPEFESRIAFKNNLLSLRNIC